MTAIRFTKMHGLGNDFVIIDARDVPIVMDDRLVRAIADRRTGVGCDQVIVYGKAGASLADAHVRIWNANGAEVEACGNASRCVAAVLMREKAVEHVILETIAGLLDAEGGENGQVTVDMGPARSDWRDIPLSAPADTLHLPVSAGPLRDAVAVNIGNPHAVFFVDDVEAVALNVHGPIVERDPLFPQFANIEVVQVLARDKLRARVWERGVGETLACGTGACATVVAAVRRGLADRRVEVTLDGGRLGIEYLPDDHVLMTGPVAVSFYGTVDPTNLA